MPDKERKSHALAKLAELRYLWVLAGRGRGPLAGPDLRPHACRKPEPSEAGALVAEGGVAEVRGREAGHRQAWLARPSPQAAFCLW